MGEPNLVISHSQGYLYQELWNSQVASNPSGLCWLVYYYYFITLLLLSLSSSALFLLFYCQLEISYSYFGRENAIVRLASGKACTAFLIGDYVGRATLGQGGPGFYENAG